jgi:hypothetical protein
MDLTVKGGYLIKFCMKLIAVISHDNNNNFFILPVSWYSTRLLPLNRQFFLIPNGINVFVDCRHKYFTSCSSQFCQNLIST